MCPESEGKQAMSANTANQSIREQGERFEEALAGLRRECEEVAERCGTIDAYVWVRLSEDLLNAGGAAQKVGCAVLATLAERGGADEAVENLVGIPNPDPETHWDYLFDLTYTAEMLRLHLANIANEVLSPLPA